MKATVEEIIRILNTNDRELMVNYLQTRSFESLEEMTLREQLREKEYSLRRITTTETAKTQKLLNNSQRVKVFG